MVSITLSIPDETRKKMQEFPEINWSGLVRKTIEEEIKKLILKQAFKDKLKKEQDFNEWAVKVVREGRRNATNS